MTEHIRTKLTHLRFMFVVSLFIASAGATATETRGFVIEAMVPGVYFFQRCDGKSQSPKSVALLDKTPERALSAAVEELRQTMSNAASRALYVEIRTTPDKQGLAATRFLRSVGHVEACDSAPRNLPVDARIYAEGREPGWTFVQTAAGARFQIQGQKPIRFPAAAFAAPGSDKSSRIFDAWSPQDGGSIRFELTEQLCVDPSAEIAAGARVTVRVGSFSVEGCALRF
jgi:hypothetical protein